MIDLKKLRTQAQADETYLYIDDGPRYPLEELIDRCEAAEAALATALKERDEADRAEGDRASERDQLEAQLATVRATALEEAAREVERLNREDQRTVGLDDAPLAIRALAPLPPGLRAVPVETLGKLRKCLQPDQSDSACSCCQSKFHALDTAGLLK